MKGKRIRKIIHDNHLSIKHLPVCWDGNDSIWFDLKNRPIRVGEFAHYFNFKRYKNKIPSLYGWGNNIYHKWLKDKSLPKDLNRLRASLYVHYRSSRHTDIAIDKNFCYDILYEIYKILKKRKVKK